MPFYEYRCEECGNIKEFRSTIDKKKVMASTLVCEHCESSNFIQVFSGIALAGSSPDNSHLPQSGSCCRGGMCNI